MRHTSRGGCSFECLSDRMGGMNNGTIITRITPESGVFEVLAGFGSRVEEKLLGFSTVVRPNGEFSWGESDHSAAAVFATPNRREAERAVHLVAADVIHTLELERGADTPPIALRISIHVDTDGLRVSWRFCFLDLGGRDE